MEGAMSDYIEKIEAATNEKEIQSNIQHYIESKTGWNVIEEEFNTIKGLQEHQFLLLNPYQDNFKGLIHHIEKFNQHIYTNPEYKHIPHKEITQKILKDFILKYDTKNHIEIYKFIFDAKDNERSLIIDKKVNKPEKYNLISFDSPNENEINIIKEKRVEGIRNSTQLPDFAIYLNGIPLFSIEVKTERAGLGKAFQDYREKESYKKFIGCIGTTGKDAFISMMPNSPMFYYWEAYGKNKNKLNQTGLEDLLTELVFNKENLMFYLFYCTFISKGYEGKDILINHRCQQYYTLKKTDLLLNRFENEPDYKFKKVVKHVQRSGKSITIRSVVNLIARKYPKAFSKVYIHVPDTVISKGIKGTFGDMTIYGTGKNVKKIETRNEYDKSIKKEPSNLEVYLMNIQKVSAEKNHNKKYSKRNVLIIIDEVHTHQIGLSSEIRHKNFPNASFLTFTATPKMEEKKNTLTNKTNIQYSDDDGYLDEFNASHALDLEIILPIAYEKAKFSQQWNQKLNKKYDKEQLKEIETYIKDDQQLRQAIDSKLDDYEKNLDEQIKKGIITQQEKLQAISQEEERIEKEEIGKLIKSSKKQNIKMVKESLIESKVNFIVDDIKEKRTKTYSDKSDTPYFKTKSFWVVDSVDMAKKCLKKVQELSNNDPLNKYNGIRFGIDYSENIRYEGEGENYDTKNTYKTLNDLNKKVIYGNEIIDDFESEEENSVDVLIIVGKYLMGYDESKLTTVYIDKIIRETSLLFQLITRPATIHENKIKGYVVDLTFGEINYNTFNKALTFYDNENKLNTFILTQQIIDEEKQCIKDELNNISKLLKIGNIDNLMTKKEVEIRKQLIKLDSNDVCDYFGSFAKINQSFDILVSPEYYYDSMDYFYRLARINQWYAEEVLNKNQVIRYTESQIKHIIKESLRTLKIESIDDIVKYQLIGKQERLASKEEKIDYENELHKARIKVNFNKPPSTSSSFFEYSQKLLEELALSDLEDEENQKKLEELNQKIDEEKKRVKNEIDKNFEGKRHFYFFYQKAIEFLLDESQKEDEEFLNIINVISKNMSDSIYEDHLKFSLNKIENLDEFSNYVIKNTNASWDQNKFNKDIKIENQKNIYKKWKKKHAEIIKNFVKSFVLDLRNEEINQ
jgi:type I site-specific restriction-modification system R (restriction) subunit